MTVETRGRLEAVRPPQPVVVTVDGRAWRGVLTARRGQARYVRWSTGQGRSHVAWVHRGAVRPAPPVPVRVTRGVPGPRPSTAAGPAAGPHDDLHARDPLPRPRRTTAPGGTASRARPEPEQGAGRRRPAVPWRSLVLPTVLLAEFLAGVALGVYGSPVNLGL